MVSRRGVAAAVVVMEAGQQVWQGWQVTRQQVEVARWVTAAGEGVTRWWW